MFKKLKARIQAKQEKEIKERLARIKYADILKYQNEILSKNEKYDFFGYMMDENNELPVFISQTREKNGIAYGEMVYASTPKILEHCIEYLTDEAKRSEAEDLDAFEDKCQKLAHSAVYQEESWEDIIESAILYISMYGTQYNY